MHAGSDRDADARPDRPSERMPRWVKVFAAVIGLAAALLAATHFVGDGMGHLPHGDGDAAPGGHSQHQP